MVEKVSPNEFRNFIITNFRYFINTKTAGGRQEIASRIMRFCDDVFKKNTTVAVAFSPELQNALLFVLEEFSANTNMMSMNMDRQMLRILDDLI